MKLVDMTKSDLKNLTVLKLRSMLKSEGEYFGRNKNFMGCITF